MLKRLYIQNFQSHKSTTIDFTEGLNVIIGQSDGGKSSIIRAISAVCYNSWDSDSMRVGQTCCKITLQTDKGVVTLTKDTKNKINAYSGIKFQNNEQFLFESVGVSVPQIVDEITGMKPLKIADAAVDIPNIMYQLDKHYMLAQVSGKSCTSNLIARIFDKVIGLGGMEQLISQISSSMINDKKQITKKMAQADQLRTDLVDELFLIEKQLNIKNAKKSKKEIEQIQSKLDKLSFYADRYSDLSYKLNSVDDKYIDLDVQFAKKLVAEIVNLQNKMYLADDICKKNIYLNQQLDICEEIKNKYCQLKLDSVEELKSLCNKLYVADRTYNKYNLYFEELKSIDSILSKYNDLSSANDILQSVKQTCNKLYKLDKLNFKLQIKNDQFAIYNKEVCQQEKNYNQFFQKLQKLKKENKICPLCGNSFQNCLEK